MKLTSLIILLSILSLSLLPSLASTQACARTCGKQPIKYPFGTGQGCGDPRFQKYITCNQDQLTFNTHTGCYPIRTVDYATQTIYVSDATMSTCACKQPSKVFSLDWDAPFSFDDSTIFALLDCSPSSSPIFKSNESTSTSLLCDSDGSSVCSLLNSCQAVSRLDNPISTCCVYAPIELGPSYEMDLQKLQCSSYSGIYGYDGKNNDANSWNYGMAIKYRFNFNNEYPTICADCEKTNGACGYIGQYNSFVCNCPSGMNTSTDCIFEASWVNKGMITLPWNIGAWFMYCLALYSLLL